MNPSIDERIKRLEDIHKDFKIIGGVNVNVEGSMESGYAICSTCPEAAGNPVGPPIPTGACCIDGVCSITTEQSCIDSGGTYQGDGTDCDPNPCACQTGYYVIDPEEGGATVYFLHADITLYYGAVSVSDPTNDFITLTASWSTDIIGECCVYGIPDNLPLIFGCQDGCIEVSDASGIFTNHFDSIPDLHCSLAIDTGGHFPCLKWGSPEPPSTNCCCNDFSVDATWYTDVFNACSGTFTEERHTDSYSLVCENVSGGNTNTFGYSVLLS
jgi:hypothetical protein